MALKIRLSRRGTKKRPFYWIVLADVRAPRDGRFLEKLGTYNPLLPKDNGDRIILVMDRIRHWLSQGAQPTDRVLRFLDGAGILSRSARNNPLKGKPGKKRLEREEAARTAREAAEKAAEEAKLAEEEAAKARAEAESQTATESSGDAQPSSDSESQAEEKEEDFEFRIIAK